MDRSDIKAIAKWMEIRAKHSYRGHDISTPRGFMIEADHSMRGGLLGWLLAGNEPSEEPPASCYSRPWHQLWADGKAAGRACIHGQGDRVLIFQHGWTLDSETDAGLLIRPRPGGSRWLLTITGEPDVYGEVAFTIERVSP